MGRRPKKSRVGKNSGQKGVQKSKADKKAKKARHGCPHPKCKKKFKTAKSVRDHCRAKHDDTVSVKKHDAQDQNGSTKSGAGKPKRKNSGQKQKGVKKCKAWAVAFKQARKNLKIKGFMACKKGSALYSETKRL